MTWLLVGVGGGLGAMTRHAVNELVQRWAMGLGFPAGIFLINVLGSGIIGLLAGLIASHQLPMSTDTRTFVFVGILGGFTTFSSFSLDTLTLIKGGQFGLAVFNVVGQVGLSLVAVLLGYKVGSAA